MTGRFLDREGALILGLGLVALLFLALAGYFLFNPPAEPPTVSEDSDRTKDSLTMLPEGSSADSTSVLQPAREIILAGQDGRTVLDLLSEGHSVVVDTELLLFGSIVLAIDSLRANGDEFWMYYRDTIPGDRPPEACTTATGETVRWVLKRRR